VQGGQTAALASTVSSDEVIDYKASESYEGYAKLSLKKYRPIAARKDDEKVINGLL
jgi:hypothetical protein